MVLERAHEREEDDVPQVFLVREEGNEPVDAEAEAGYRRHTVLHSLEEVLVDDHRLGIPSPPELRLSLEPSALVYWVDELAIGVHDLPAVDHNLKAVGDSAVVVVFS